MIKILESLLPMQAVNEKVSRKGKNFQKIFQFCYEYKKRSMDEGHETPIMDALVFRSARKLFGAKLRFIAVGKINLDALVLSVRL
jgi:long-subunit acyl-CoA synthetase (AMP-forming)